MQGVPCDISVYTCIIIQIVSFPLVFFFLP
jgi:hypothetical protein